MGRRGGMIVPIILLFIIAAAAIWLRIKPPKEFIINRPSPVAVATPDATPSFTNIQDTGIITGSISYPGEQIPADLIVCANNINTLQQTCTSEHISSDNFTYGVGYELELPPGDYEVYAMLTQQNQTKAYYSEFVTCGLQANCSSHDPIIVSVESDQIITNINPGDWYAQ